MNYYDLVLGSIPASFLGVTGGSAILGVDITFAIPIAALLAMVVIAHALFVRAPTSSAEPVTTEPTRASQGAIPVAD